MKIQYEQKTKVNRSINVQLQLTEYSTRKLQKDTETVTERTRMVIGH